MILNSHTIKADHETTNSPVVLLHGLFGSLSNLGVIGRALSVNHTVIQFDLRNHGLSPHSAEMNYEIMAQDVIDTLNELKIEQFSVIGHSMGGKVAMKIAATYPDLVDELVVLDISPVVYHGHRHEAILKAIHAVRAEQQELSRKQATDIMKQYIAQDGVIMFLLKSFHQGSWLFNVDAIEAKYQDIIGWNDNPVWSKPCLFIKGADSDYIEPQYEPQLHAQFPLAQIKTIEAAGHWLHAEQPKEVIQAIQIFLHEQGESGV